MAEIFKAACVQMTSGPEIEENIAVASDFIHAAAAEGAQLIATPENTCHIRSPMREKLETSQSEADHPAITAFSNLANELDIILLIGSLSIRSSAGDKIHNRSYLFGRDGSVLATYDKIHLFDVTLPDGESHRESDFFEAGEQGRVVKTDLAKLGLSICYDLRFAYLYRAMAQEGANVMMVPSAFTVSTGRAHWEVLLRARAIETGSFVIAPGQTGEHHGGRKTWGHSMIINPWGDVMAQADQEPGFITADINLKRVDTARTAIPALTHDRGFELDKS